MSQSITIPKQNDSYPTNLPCDDGIPLETPIHRENMNILIDSSVVAMGDKTDFFAGGNMFMYYSGKEVKNEAFRGPDFFLVKGVDGTKERDSWILWEENWKYPNIIVELLSESTYKIDLEDKFILYEQTFHTPEYFVYDPKNPSYLCGWRLNRYGFYVELVKNKNGWLCSKELNCYLGIWSGGLNGKHRTYLRLYDKDKNLILLESEQEKERAEKERLEKEKALGELQERDKLIAELQAKLGKMNVYNPQRKHE
ncbi:MAG: Uma2 family endonuclease [Leptospiraceae bacterium]|nr:Uma2 family endonuclease [Leptospiraceae bacterium]MCP5497436.1 Uma2 family endonuclease [Leptospiraceae bacterium]